MTEYSYELRKLLKESDRKPLKINNEFYYEYTGPIDNEIFKEYKNNSKVFVSNMGRIKINGEIKKQQIKDKYLTINIFGKIEYVHRIVAETFLDTIKECYIVHHISGDSFDNRVENLDYVACFEHLVIHDYFPQICIDGHKYWEKNNPEYCKNCSAKHYTGLEEYQPQNLPTR